MELEVIESFRNFPFGMIISTAENLLESNAIIVVNEMTKLPISLFLPVIYSDCI